MDRLLLHIQTITDFADGICKDEMTSTQLNRACMILLDKTNTVQFAYGGVGIDYDHSTPNNPWNRTPHVPRYIV